MYRSRSCIEIENGGIYRRNKQLLRKTNESFPQIKKSAPNALARQDRDSFEKLQNDASISPPLQPSPDSIISVELSCDF